jgi:hypothetical protein
VLIRRPPVLIVRASIEPAMMEDFLEWYQREHLPHVMDIPGVVRAYRSTCHRRGVNWTAVYELSDDTSVQKAIASTEADRARRDWEPWLPHVHDLSVEVYAQLGPLPSFHHWN